MKIVDEVMTKTIESVVPSTSLQHAAQKMAANNIGFLLVCEEGNELVGCLTDRDLAVRVVAKGLEVRNLKVADVMSRNVLTIRRGEKIQRAYELLREHYLRRLVVVDSNDKPVGVVSYGDLAAHASEEEYREFGELYHKLTEDLVS